MATYFLSFLVTEPICTAEYPFTDCPPYAYGVPGGLITLKWDYQDIKPVGIIFSIIQSHVKPILEYDAVSNTSRATNNFNASFELPSSLTVNNIPDDFSGELKCFLLADQSLYAHSLNMTLCADEGEMAHIMWDVEYGIQQHFAMVAHIVRDAYLTIQVLNFQLRQFWE